MFPACTLLTHPVSEREGESTLAGENCPIVGVETFGDCGWSEVEADRRGNAGTAVWIGEGPATPIVSFFFLNDIFDSSTFWEIGRWATRAFIEFPTGSVNNIGIS